MLELRPNCECCDCDLPPESTKARICTFECTFCADCAEVKLQNVCPNCGDEAKDLYTFSGKGEVYSYTTIYEAPAGYLFR